MWSRTVDHEVRDRADVEHLTGHGIDLTDERTREAVAEMFANEPHDLTDGLKLALINYNDVDDLAPTETDKTDAFTDPNALPIDTMPTSGHDVQLFGTMSVPVPARTIEAPPLAPGDGTW
ncbi:hypothetical protein [Kocuria aegyptia]|uniref:Uncharacterized protein n=1 Tax=Kocuria aegyptia TaxID=330943 RepID=A0ABN2K3M3_9MICC